MFLERISNFLVKNRKKIFFYSLFAFVFFILSSDISFAADKTQESANNLLKVFNSILAGLASLVGIFTYFVTMLLDPAYTNGSLFGIDKKLHEVWILVSNVVYFIFAFILIWIAFMNILGKGDSKWELKQALPKFIIGVFIVPFSWFFVGLIVSISNLLTVAALSLPSDTFTEYRTYLEKIEIPKTCTINLFDTGEENNSNGAAGSNGASQGGESDGQWMTCEDEKIPLGNSMKDSVFGLISSYTFGLLKISEADTVDKSAIQLGLKTVGDVLIYIVFNSLFVLVYGILLITLAIVLLVRGIYLWIYMALSPLFGLSYFFGKDGGGDLLKKFSVGEFVALAMVPVYAMLALSFGFLFLSITMTGIAGSTEAGGVSSSNYSIKDDTITIKNLGGKDADGNDTEFKLTVKGAAFSQLQKASGRSADFFGGVADLGLGIIGAFFMNIFGIVVFRLAVMSALRSSEITKQITEPIYGFGKSIGDLALKAPTYAPVFGGQSMQSMQNIAGSAKTYYTSTKPSESASKFMKDNNLFGNKADLNSSIAKLEQALSTNKNGIDQNILSEANNMLKNAGNLENAHKDEKVVDKLLEVAKRLGITNFKKTEIRADKQKYLDLLKQIDLKAEKTSINGRTLDFIKGIHGRDAKLNGDDQYNAIFYNGKTPKDVSADIPSHDTTQKVEVAYSTTDNTIPVRLEIDGQTVSLGHDGKLGSQLEKGYFVSAVNSKNKAELAEAFKKKSLDLESYLKQIEDLYKVGLDNDGNLKIEKK